MEEMVAVGTENSPAPSLNDSLTDLIEDEYTLINNAVNEGKAEELKLPDVTKLVNMSMEKAKFDSDNANRTHKVQLRASSAPIPMLL